MSTRLHIAFVLRLLVVVFVTGSLAGQASVSVKSVRAEEARKIKTLIASVEQLKDAKFVRNGKAYDPTTAAKFLRAKWDRYSSEIETADEFIAKIGTRSSTTGRVYLVRFSDGREVSLASFLRSKLENLR